MSTREDRLEDAREWGREILHGDPPEPEPRGQDCMTCGSKGFALRPCVDCGRSRSLESYRSGLIEPVEDLEPVEPVEGQESLFGDVEP